MKGLQTFNLFLPLKKLTFGGTLHTRVDGVQLDVSCVPGDVVLFFKTELTLPRIGPLWPFLRGSFLRDASRRSKDRFLFKMLSF